MFAFVLLMEFLFFFFTFRCFEFCKTPQYEVLTEMIMVKVMGFNKLSFVLYQFSGLFSYFRFFGLHSL